MTDDHIDLKCFKFSEEETTYQRWQQAQQWELAFWNRQNIPSPFWKRLLRPLLVLIGLRQRQQISNLDDRNRWWKEKFNDYNDLPQRFENVCELGCGPYTNLRVILEEREAQYVHCSDPLARKYIRYPNAWLANMYRAGLVSVDSHPAESCPFKSDYFDLTVMINVLDHTRNPFRCLEEAIRITAPRGYFVFGQDLTGKTEKKPANSGHPFYFNHDQLLPILNRFCTPVLSKIISRNEVHDPGMHYGALVYIGQKLSPNKGIS